MSAAMAITVGLAMLSGSCFFGAKTEVCAISGLRCPLGAVCSADGKTCIQGGCGDGVVDIDEVCDDGNVTGEDGCSADCKSNEACGNGILDPGESCDDGKNDDGDACSATCVLAACGNGSVDLNEQCDPAIPEQNTATCDKDCSFIVCGDGLENTAAGEECDTGDPLNPTPNGAPNTSTCNGPLCTRAMCGDSYFNPMAGEECDTGEDSKACNGANINRGDAAAFCKVPRCGDRYTNKELILPGLGMRTEECDTGGVNAIDCDLDCTKPVCGDGIHNSMAGEECDDANTSDTDACVNVAGVCRNARCGDGHLRAPVPPIEMCDDGNDDTTDDCPSGPNGNCQPATCGDGYINLANGEMCDPGNADKGPVGCMAPAICTTMGQDACRKCVIK
jgi:cysteine-rich repeat protein